MQCFCLTKTKQQLSTFSGKCRSGGPETPPPRAGRSGFFFVNANQSTISVEFTKPSLFCVFVVFCLFLFVFCLYKKNDICIIYQTLFILCLSIFVCLLLLNKSNGKNEPLYNLQNPRCLLFVYFLFAFVCVM